MLRGVIAVWSSPTWRAEAAAWLDERLAAAGIERTGEVEQPHLRPWATALRAPTTAGPVWLKASGPGTRFEAGLYAVLARAAPEHVLVPLALDPARGWMLLPDGGPSLGARASGPDVLAGLAGALVRYGRLQRALEPHVGAMLGAGVPDMRPAAMPGRFGEALAAVRATTGPAGHEVAARVAQIEPRFAAWCERLAASPLRVSLDHNDLHPWNVLADGARFYDWGDSVVAHPLAATLVPLGLLRRGLGDHDFIRARDAYLDVFSDVAPRAELVETLGLACRVAKIARVLTWERALRAAGAQGAAVDERWLAATRDTLASVLDDGYLGGA
jgi:Phosphotransferase enzyme family